MRLKLTLHIVVKSAVLENIGGSVNKSSKYRVFKNRRLLQNPYAHIEHIEEFAARAQAEPAVTPHANSASAPRRYTDREIETLAKHLHSRLWKERMSLWDGAAPADPIDLLDPAVAFRLVGYEFTLEESLGQYHGKGGQVEVAGLIDGDSRTVHVSRRLPKSVRAFTAAHELGHAVLHNTRGGIHRDRPLDGATLSRDPTELEADKFATCFIMPAKLVNARFANLFGTECFVLTDDTAFALCNAPLDKVQAKLSTRRDLSRLLANTEHYNGHFFYSLATQFRVSIEAMAIRLEELALVDG